MGLRSGRLMPSHRFATLHSSQRYVAWEAALAALATAGPLRRALDVLKLGGTRSLMLAREQHRSGST